MHQELRTLIDAFRDAQDRAVDYLHVSLNIPLPTSGLDWAHNGFSAINAVGRASDRVDVRLDPHGFGIDIVHPGFRIDFDYGPAGQVDCFDVWRLALHRHHLVGDDPPVGPYDDIRTWVHDSVKCGELVVVPDTYDAFFQDPTRLRPPPNSVDRVR